MEARYMQLKEAIGERFYLERNRKETIIKRILGLATDDKPTVDKQFHRCRDELAQRISDEIGRLRATMTSSTPTAKAKRVKQRSIATQCALRQSSLMDRLQTSLSGVDFTIDKFSSEHKFACTSPRFSHEEQLKCRPRLRTIGVQKNAKDGHKPPAPTAYISDTQEKPLRASGGASGDGGDDKSPLLPFISTSCFDFDVGNARPIEVYHYQCPSTAIATCGGRCCNCGVCHHHQGNQHLQHYHQQQQQLNGNGVYNKKLYVEHDISPQRRLSRYCCNEYYYECPCARPNATNSAAIVPIAVAPPPAVLHSCNQLTSPTPLTLCRCAQIRNALQQQQQRQQQELQKLEEYCKHKRRCSDLNTNEFFQGKTDMLRRMRQQTRRKDAKTMEKYMLSLLKNSRRSKRSEARTPSPAARGRTHGRSAQSKSHRSGSHNRRHRTWDSELRQRLERVEKVAKRFKNRLSKLYSHSDGEDGADGGVSSQSSDDQSSTRSPTTSRSRKNRDSTDRPKPSAYDSPVADYPQDTLRAMKRMHVTPYEPKRRRQLHDEQGDLSELSDLINGDNRDGDLDADHANDSANDDGYVNRKEIQKATAPESPKAMSSSTSDVIKNLQQQQQQQNAQHEVSPAPSNGWPSDADANELETPLLQPVMLNDSNSQQQRQQPQQQYPENKLPQAQTNERESNAEDITVTSVEPENGVISQQQRLQQLEQQQYPQYVQPEQQPQYVYTQPQQQQQYPPLQQHQLYPQYDPPQPPQQQQLYLQYGLPQEQPNGWQRNADADEVQPLLPVILSGSKSQQPPKQPEQQKQRQRRQQRDYNDKADDIYASPLIDVEDENADDQRQLPSSSKSNNAKSKNFSAENDDIPLQQQVVEEELSERQQTQSQGEQRQWPQQQSQPQQWPQMQQQQQAQPKQQSQPQQWSQQQPQLQQTRDDKPPFVGPRAINPKSLNAPRLHQNMEKIQQSYDSFKNSNDRQFPVLDVPKTKGDISNGYNSDARRGGTNSNRLSSDKIYLSSTKPQSRNLSPVNSFPKQTIGANKIRSSSPNSSDIDETPYPNRIVAYESQRSGFARTEANNRGIEEIRDTGLASRRPNMPIEDLEMQIMENAMQSSNIPKASDYDSEKPDASGINSFVPTTAQLNDDEFKDLEHFPMFRTQSTTNQSICSWNSCSSCEDICTGYIECTIPEFKGCPCMWDTYLQILRICCDKGVPAISCD